MKNRITKTQTLLSLGLVLLVSTTACRSSETPAVDSSNVSPSVESTRDVEPDVEPTALETIEVSEVVEPIAAEKPAAVVEAVAQEVTTETQTVTETQPIARVAAGIGLAGDGFNIFVGDGSSTNRLVFGSDMSRVVSFLTDVWGEPLRIFEESLCEPRNEMFGAVIWPNGMIIDSKDGEFVGWRTRSSATLATMYGLRLGTPVAELEDAAVVINFFEDTVFGPSFYVGAGNGIEGALSSSDEDAVVTSLSAGDQCVYR